MLSINYHEIQLQFVRIDVLYYFVFLETVTPAIPALSAMER